MDYTGKRHVSHFNSDYSSHSLFLSFLFFLFYFLQQALGLCLSYLFWMKLKHICSNYDEVDFRSLKLKDFKFKELDLSGAGCCLCLPREEGYIPVNADSDDEKLT